MDRSEKEKTASKLHLEEISYYEKETPIFS
jgi:hypothetical protein